MHPIAFNLGTFAITMQGFFLVFGFLISIWVARRKAIDEGITQSTVIDCGPWLVVGSILGARATYVIGHWDQAFVGKPFWAIFLLNKDGLVTYGGCIGALGALCVYLYLRTIPVWKFGDAVASAIPLGFIFVCLGSLASGDAFGSPTTLPWAIRFPADHETGGLPVHPTQIYKAVLSLGLYALLSWFYARKTFDGQILSLSLIGFALVFGGLDSCRGDYTNGGWDALLTKSQFASLGLLGLGLVLYIVRRRSGRHGNPTVLHRQI
ncbi:MAG: prolipoprotein diacylglyceryl transferase [Verrucomicrobiales bacterium]|nr:prolipoprotein diacylglyceryl transferase [Verrucomicrobiales bacterium]